MGNYVNYILSRWLTGWLMRTRARAALAPCRRDEKGNSYIKNIRFVQGCGWVMLVCGLAALVLTVGMDAAGSTLGYVMGLVAGLFGSIGSIAVIGKKITLTDDRLVHQRLFFIKDTHSLEALRQQNNAAVTKTGSILLMDGFQTVRVPLGLHGSFAFAEELRNKLHITYDAKFYTLLKEAEKDRKDIDDLMGD